MDDYKLVGKDVVREMMGGGFGPAICTHPLIKEGEGT